MYNTKNNAYKVWADHYTKTSKPNRIYTVRDNSKEARDFENKRQLILELANAFR